MSWSLGTRLMALLEDRQEELDSEPAPESVPEFAEEAPCACNTCNRPFNQIFLWCPCPAGCGGTVRMK